MRLLAVFGIVALAEMATFFWVESRIGLGWALGIAVLTAVLGSFLVKRAGVSVWARLRERTSRGEVPGRELSDGAAVLVAGAFLISPGFITDTLGFLLLVPPIQAWIYSILSSRIKGRVQVFTADRVDQTGWSNDVIDVEEIE